MGRRKRDLSHAERLDLVAPEEQCPWCGRKLWIVQRRERYVQRLDKLLYVVPHDKKCPSPTCPGPSLLYRSAEEGWLALKDHEFGLDVVIFTGEQYHREHLSIPKIHRRLRDEHRMAICERSVGNQIEAYEALCECVAGDTQRLQARLQKQGAIMLSVDGVQYDDRSPVLYVQRDVLCGEVLYAERRPTRAKDDLVPMLRRTAELARQIGVPIVGVASDKERSLVPAIAEVFPGIPHQFCQTHYLGNVAKLLEPDTQRLQQKAREVVLALREVQRDIQRQVPAAEGNGTPREPAAVQTPPEAAVAAALARAGTTVGQVSGRPIVDPAGLKRFESLENVRAAVEQAAKKSGATRRLAMARETSSDLLVAGRPSASGQPSQATCGHRSSHRSPSG